MSIAGSIMRIVAACARRPWLVIAIALVLCASAFTYTAGHLAMDTDSAKLIDEHLGWRQRERVFDAAFPHRTDLIAIVIDGSTPESAEEAAAALTLRLSTASGLYRAVWRPDGGPFFEQEGLLFESTAQITRTTHQLIAAQPLLGVLAADATLRGLMDALTLMFEGAANDPTALAELSGPVSRLAAAFEAIAAGKLAPFSWQALISGGAPAARENRRFILVQPILDYGALRPGEAATGAIRAAIHALGLDGDPRVAIRLTGPVPLADEEFGTLAEGAVLNAALMVLAIVALLWFALRSVKMVVAILLSLTAGLVLTAAFGLIAFGAFNLISVAFAVLFVGLGVDFCIQFCMSYRAQRHLTGDLQLALPDAGREVGAALALAAASTAAGFYAFLPTEYRGVSELGAIAGTGMIVAFISSITLLPALLVIFQPSGEREAVGYASLASLDRFLVTRRRPVLIAFALVAIVSIALVPRLQFDANPLHLRSVEAESVATLLDLMQDPNTAPDTIDMLEPSLDAAIAAAQLVEQLPEVDHALTLASFVPEQQPEKLALIEDAALLLGPVLEPDAAKPQPSDEDVIAAMKRTAVALENAAANASGAPVAGAAQHLSQALSTIAQGSPQDRERARRALIPGLVTMLAQVRSAMQAHPVTVATLPDELRRDWVASDGRARVEVFPKGDTSSNETLRRFVAAVTSVAPNATGAPVAIEESSRTIVHAFVEAGWWALLAIVVLLALVLRRASDVALTLAPLALSGLLTLAVCSAARLPLNFENIIALPLLLGIGVAFNIYFVTAWRAGRDGLLQSSLTRAVIFSALTTGTAFGSLWLSHHPGTSSMGKLLALSLVCTLASALLFLPALLGKSPARR